MTSRMKAMFGSSRPWRIDWIASSLSVTVVAPFVWTTTCAPLT
jgi:hypothetical protein